MGGHDPQPGFLPELWPCVHEVTVAGMRPPSRGLGVSSYVQDFPHRVQSLAEGLGQALAHAGSLDTTYIQ